MSAGRGNEDRREKGEKQRNWRGQWTWSTYEVTVPKGQKMEDPSSPSSLPKGPQT